MIDSDVTFLDEAPQTVITPLLDKNLVPKLREILMNMGLRPGQIIGDQPANRTEFRSNYPPFCVSESF